MNLYFKDKYGLLFESHQVYTELPGLHVQFVIKKFRDARGISDVFPPYHDGDTDQFVVTVVPFRNADVVTIVFLFHQPFTCPNRIEHLNRGWRVAEHRLRLKLRLEPVNEVLHVLEPHSGSETSVTTVLLFCGCVRLWQLSFADSRVWGPSLF